MGDPHRVYEIRCPVHGFIPFDDWEREIISQPAFQRLRRIRQLGWTDQVYPGAMHTRFEHALGVMHMATLLYDEIVKRSLPVLKSELAYNEVGLRRDKQLVRFAALLHDVGHGPFSHAAEELLPLKGDSGERFAHEDYSAAIVRRFFRDVIEDHPLNTNYDFKAEDIAGFLEGSIQARKTVFWRDLITGQMDADRIDYLIRDSLHAGVDYGRFDWQRLLNTVEAVPWPNGRAPRLGINEGGLHAAEGLVLARFFMFTQVYFHKTRIAFDHHLRGALRALLPNGFPSPEGSALDEYLKWDDWRLLGLLADGQGGDHGKRLATRNHFREIHHTPETPSEADLAQLQEVRQGLGPLLAAEEHSDKSWYYLDKTEIPVVDTRRRVLPLSHFSLLMKNLAPIGLVRLYVRPEDVEEANRKVADLLKGASHD